MQENEMDRSGKIIIRICIFSIVLSLTALVLCYAFQRWNGKQRSTWSNNPEFTVVIDAGHGGEDGGASSKDGTKEKDLNLSVALQLKSILSASGFNVVLTRSDDSMLYTDKTHGSLKMQDLKNRLAVANSTENGILISIHMNKFSQEKYSGLQVFYSKNNDKSIEIARSIQQSNHSFLQTQNTREIKPAGSNIYLLDNAKVPAVLVECGFLSNPEECEKLKSTDYQKQLAAVISGAIIDLYG